MKRMAHSIEDTMKATRVVLIALCFALAGSAVAATDALPIRFDRLSVEEGLSQATVLALHQDSRGFLWAATEDGLNRYDGTGFEVFRMLSATTARTRGGLARSGSCAS